MPGLGALLDAMRARLAARADGLSVTAQKDADLFLAGAAPQSQYGVARLKRKAPPLL